MSEKVNKLLEEELVQSIKDLSGDEYGSEERKRRIEEISDLNKTLNENEKAKSERKTERIKTGVTIGSLVVSVGTLLAHVKMFYDGLDFEKTGTVASSFVKIIQGVIKPRG